MEPGSKKSLLLIPTPVTELILCKWARCLFHINRFISSWACYDQTSAALHRYKVEDDPAGWLTVDPHTGDITTVKMPDRESPHVVNGVYTVKLNAVDTGKSTCCYVAVSIDANQIFLGSIKDLCLNTTDL